VFKNQLVPYSTLIPSTAVQSAIQGAGTGLVRCQGFTMDSAVLGLAPLG
jgi:hypothetical protein